MSTPQFRDNASISVVRNAQSITIFVRNMVEGKDENGRKTLRPGTMLPKPIVLPFDKLSDAVRAEALGYGMEVRLTRAAAIEHAKSGRAATAQERWDAINRLAEHYASGTQDWAMRSSGGGGLSSDTQDLIDAVALALEVDRDAAEAQIRTFTSAQRAKLRLDPEIKAALEMVWSQKGEGVDTKSLKDSLRSLKG